MATLAGRAYIDVAYDPKSIETLRTQTAAAGKKAGDSFASSFAKSGPALTRVGHTLTRNLTLPIGLAGAAATKYAYDFVAVAEPHQRARRRRLDADGSVPQRDPETRAGGRSGADAAR